MAYKKKVFSDDELIRRVWDSEDIKNLISRFSYYEAANKRAESVKELWVSEPENRKTASFGRNWGFIVGMDAIEDYYVGKNRFGADGTSTMHPFSTKLLCLAEDGKTAQGIWMGNGYDTAPNEEGTLEATWVNERMAIDFIKEADGWKIWHMFIGTNYVCPAGTNYSEQEIITEKRAYGDGNPAWYMVGNGKEIMKADVAVTDQILSYAERGVFTPTIPCDAYTALYNDQIAFPPLPVDYRTFDDTVGYDYEGFRSVFAESLGRVL